MEGADERRGIPGRAEAKEWSLWPEALNRPRPSGERDHHLHLRSTIAAQQLVLCESTRFVVAEWAMTGMYFLFTCMDFVFIVSGSDY